VKNVEICGNKKEIKMYVFMISGNNRERRCLYGEKI